MRSAGKSWKKRSFVTALLASSLIMLVAAASAAAAPVWQIDSFSNSHAAPGDGNPATVEHTYQVEIDNIGDEAIDSSIEPVELSVALPDAISLVQATEVHGTFEFPWDCSGTSQGDHDFSCTFAGGGIGGPPQNHRRMAIEVSLDPGAPEFSTASFTVSGGGAPPATTVDPLRISATAPPFGLDAFDVRTVAGPSGAPFAQAGGHPYALTTYLDLNTVTNPEPLKGEGWPVEPIRDGVASAPPGLIAAPRDFAECTAAQLAVSQSVIATPECPTTSQVGIVRLHINGFGFIPNLLGPFPLFNMVPAAGEPARFGFQFAGTSVTLGTRLRSESDYGIDVLSRRISEGVALAGAQVTVWGAPTDPDHNLGFERACSGQAAPFQGGPTCPATIEQPGFLRLPSSCTPPGQGLPWRMSVDSWDNPGAELPSGAPDLSDPAWDSVTIASHDPPGYPFAPKDWGQSSGTDGCESVPVKGKLTAQPTALDTETSSGLSVAVEIPNPGLETPTGISASDIKRVKVSLPQGMTINPSQAEGLGVCSPERYESTELSFYATPGKGCPDDSKIGTVSVKTPLLKEALPGNVYIAKPFDNPFNSLLALYIVITEPERGVLVTLPGEVRTNEKTGRIEAEFDDLPQVPFAAFDFKFREGARAPLVTPPTCGTYETVTEIEGWSAPGKPITSKSSFQITRGIGGGACPPGGTPGFKPSFSAGSINNNAGAYSPFVMRITRLDGEQDMTRFSATLPPGVLGKLAGVDKCPGSAVAIAKAKTGLEERANPSCPANSAIGRSLVGAGVGSVLTHVPGKVYLGGPFNGRPLSVIAITPAVAGPFDVGTVAVQLALTLNPKTAEVEVDGSASDPIPHMLKGIPAKLRDLRVYVDRPEFTLNPTSCDESQTKAELFGGGGNAFTSADDVPILLQDRFQAASCSSLGFKPRLGLKLKGGTRRGGFPGLQATYRPRPGNANVEGLVVRLPRSAFLEQGHIRTICTRVQFAADACPKASRYGYIKAWTPLLDEPLQGPVWLRSSNNKLPDLVFDLHGLVDIEVATRIDSIRGGVRATVNQIPDAPLSKVVLRMQGGKKGLIVNSRNLCASKNRANVESDGQNGKVSDFNPVMRPDCGGKKRRGKKRR